MLRFASFLFAACLAATVAPAAELELQFGAVERIIAQQIFTQEGRLYVRGNAATKCQYAYIEKPHVGGESGFLRVNGRFSGRSALGVMGRCVGLGDSFDFTLLATPIVRDGALGLKDVNITTLRDSYYIRKVREAMVQSITRGFKVDVQSQAHRLLDEKPDQAPSDPLYRRELATFQLRNVRATSDAIVLDVDFRLVVK